VVAKLNPRLQLAILAKRLRLIRLAACVISERAAMAGTMILPRSSEHSVRQIDIVSTAKAELFE